MPLDQALLKGTQSREWVVAKPPVGAIPQWVYTGRDESGLGPIYVALASISAPPSRETMRALHTAYKGKSNIQLVVGAVLGHQVWIFGPDERTEVTDSLALDQGCRQLQSALDEPDAIAAYTRLGQFRRSLDTTSLVGVINSGLFASYHIRENVPKRSDWKESCEKAKPLLALRNEHLIKALGFKSEKTAGNALLLTTGTPQSKAVAILLDETEQFDATSARHTGISPVAFGLNVAARQGVPWLFVLRKDQIRIYPAKDGVGVGQKGQVETYLEIDLAAIDSARAGLLTLIFSADALEPNGTAQDLLKGSQLFAAQLGLRLRERIYEHVVPQLSKSVAEHLRDQGTHLDSEGLSLAYRLSLRILFRLLFQAYAEDRGLLPAGRNEGYDANSLKTIAKRIQSTPEELFGKSKTLWFDLVQVWDAIDEGNETWNVPAYNGGLFGTDTDVHPEGALIEKLGIQDDVLGPVLQHLLLDVSEDGVLGPVDFRSLSVREFGTIYEGLLESSLSVATQDLGVDSKGAWIPVENTDQVLARKGDVYFHSASGERKATGSYFTPSVVVDHLIDRSLDPALEAHLDKIKNLLDQGDLALAARNFFDFRVADLAMGSGHFLVAAIDRIEAKMRIFLADPLTQVPGINAELMRLAKAAKLALGKDESAIGEIEPAALLRRQIARRCIYGLDVNPLAVELSRLAIWIHTFVPGLPMSSLNHGLVCANSLTGIGTIDEAIQALSPDSQLVELKKGHGAPITFFEGAIFENLEKVKELLIEVSNSDEARKSEVKVSEELLQKARRDAEPTKAIFDAAVAARLGVIDPRIIFDSESLIAIANSSEVKNNISILNPAHLPFLFPEVFLRESSGFDVLLGNPPWEKIKVEEHQWWGMHIPGLRGMAQKEKNKALAEIQSSRKDLVMEYESEVKRVEAYRTVIVKGPYPGIGSGGDPDLFQAFAWRNWQLTNKKGLAGIVLPRGALSGSSLKNWRQVILDSGSFRDVCFLSNAGGWIFEGVDGRYTIGLAVFGKSDDHSVSFSGPFFSEAEMLEGRQFFTKADKNEFLSWSGTAAFPLIHSERSASVFRKMKKQPRFDTRSPEWDFRPYVELHATADKEFFDFDIEESRDRTPVLTGASFNLWAPNFGSPYAYADTDAILEVLLRKARSASSNARSAYFGMKFNSEKDLPISKPRLTFRDITNQTNTRTTIVCLVPAGVALTHKAPFLVNRSDSNEPEAFLLGVMSSLPFDWYMRRWVELHITYELLNPAPIPQPPVRNILRKRIVEIVCSLQSLEQGYEEWIASINSDFKINTSDLDPTELKFELDALVALLFELNRDDLIQVFTTFHRGWQYEQSLERVIYYFEIWERKEW